MQIQFTGKNIDVTDALRDLVTRKLTSLNNHIEIDHVLVVFTVENREQIVKATAHARDGFEFNGTGKSDDMYKSVDKLVNILDQQAIKHKTKIKDRKYQERVIPE